MCRVANRNKQNSRYDSVNYAAEHKNSAVSLCCYLDNSNCSIAVLYGRALDNQRSS